LSRLWDRHEVRACATREAAALTNPPTTVRFIPTTSCPASVLLRHAETIRQMPYFFYNSSAERLWPSLGDGTHREPAPHGEPNVSGSRRRARRRDWLVLGNPKTRIFAELLIDCEEDRMLRVVLVGMLPEAVKLRLGSSAHREPAPHGDPAV
jgi:hypothetical protein